MHFNTASLLNQAALWLQTNVGSCSVCMTKAAAMLPSSFGFGLLFVYKVRLKLSSCSVSLQGVPVN